MKLTVALLAWATAAAADAHLPRQNQNQSGEAGYLPLTIMGDTGRVQYLTTKVSIGTPAQELNVELVLADSGSLSMFDSCPNWPDMCYRPNASSTLQNRTQADGDGTYLYDTVTIGGVSADIRVGRADSERSPSLAGVAGTLHLDTRPVNATNTTGRNGTSDTTDGSPSIWPAYRSQWPEERVGMFLASLPTTYNNSGEFRPVGAYAGTITLGGVNDSLYTGEITYADTVAPPTDVPPAITYIALTSLNVNGQDIPINTTGGSGAGYNTLQLIAEPFLAIPRQYATQAAAALNASTTIVYPTTADDDPDQDDDKDMPGWVFPCDTNASVAIGINGNTFTIRIADFLMRNDTGACKAQLILMHETAPLLVGIPLINKYVVLDYAANKVGFADLSAAANSTNRGNATADTGNSTDSNGTDSTSNGGGNAAQALGPSLVWVMALAAVPAAVLVAF